MSRWHRSSLFSVLLLLLLPFAGHAQISIGVSVNIAPPELPVYEQPPIPGEGYLWTPGYWGFENGAYLWHEGYWGPHIGFYGGVDYGFGYRGEGWVGGEWRGGHLFYNSAVVNVSNTHITNVYVNRTVINNVTVNHVAYNGGPGGIQARPTAAQEAVAHERHLPPIAAQREQITRARANPQMRASANHGAPPVAATPRPGVFKGAGVVHARAASPAAAAAAARIHTEAAKAGPARGAEGTRPAERPAPQSERAPERRAVPERPAERAAPRPAP